MEETVTIEEDPGTPTSHVSVVTSDDGTTRRTETKVLLLSSATFSYVIVLMTLLDMQMHTSAHSCSQHLMVMFFNELL